MKFSPSLITFAFVCIAAGIFVISSKLDPERLELEQPSPLAGPTSPQTPAKISRTSSPSARLPELSSSFLNRYESLKQLSNGPEKVEALASLFKDWGEKEGEAAFLFAENHTGRDHLNYLASAAAGWAKVAPRAAWAAMMEISNQGAMLPKQLGLVIESIAQNDPLLATGLLFEVKSRLNRSGLFSQLVRQLETDQSRTAVLDKLLTSQIEGREFLAQTLFRDWGRYDSDAPLAQLALIEDPTISHEAMMGFLKGWAATDGKAAFDYVQKSGDPQLISNALPSIAKEWALSSTANEMLGLIKTVTQLENSDPILKNLVPTLAQANPQLALDLIASFDDEAARANHTRDALTIWANSDLSAAEEHYLNLPPSTEKNYAIWGLFSPSIHQGIPVDRIMLHVDSLQNPKAIGHALNSMADYTNTVDLGERTQELKSGIERYLSQHSDISDEQREKIMNNLLKPRN